MIDILIVLAHLDDAPIFCGGTILNYIRSGKSVYVCSLTGPKSKLEETQAKEAFSLLNCPYNDFGLDSANRVIPEDVNKMIVNSLRQLRPEIIVTHWEKDSNPSHIRTFEATQAAITKNIIESNGEYPRELYACNTYYAWGYDRTAFSPTNFISTTSTWEVKLEAVQCFENQWTNIWVEMIGVMDRLNGLRCGERTAEAFVKMSTLSSLKGGEKSSSFL